MIREQINTLDQCFLNCVPQNLGVPLNLIMKDFAERYADNFTQYSRL